MVALGMLNKQIAGQLGTSENTVKVHRSRAMEKMHAPYLRNWFECSRSSRILRQRLHKRKHYSHSPFRRR